jgi:hypothetical protein
MRESILKTAVEIFIAESALDDHQYWNYEWGREHVELFAKGIIAAMIFVLAEKSNSQDSLKDKNNE